MLGGEPLAWGWVVSDLVPALMQTVVSSATLTLSHDTYHNAPVPLAIIAAVEREQQCIFNLRRYGKYQSPNGVS
jgi:hypothetical protein